jgi:hypothetical protein
VSATTLDTDRRRSTVFRAALLLTAAGIVLAGCGGVTEPVASHRTTASGADLPAEVTVPSGENPPTHARTSQAPAATPDPGAEGSPVTASAAPTSLTTHVTLTPEELADIDRLLAGMDAHLADADNDAATPEGDLG